jgi:hypothetical protein
VEHVIMAKAKTSTAAKAAPAPAPVAPAKAAPVAAAPAPAAKPAAKAAAKPAVSAADRYRMIQEAAYFIAEKRGFAPGNHEQDWAEATAQIDRLLAK